MPGTAKVNPDLQKERNKATFPVHVMTYVLDGDPEKTKRRRYVENLVLNDPVYKHKPVCFMSRGERYSLGMKKALHAVKKLKELNLTDPADQYYYRSFTMPHENSPIALQDDMFIPILSTQTSDEQKAKWLTLAKSLQIIGTYAQTEIGHGSTKLMRIPPLPFTMESQSPVYDL